MAESVKELQEEMRCYLSFSEEKVFKGMVPAEETSAIWPEEATMVMNTEPAVEKRPPRLCLGWEKVLHPSHPVMAARQIPHLLRGPRLRFCNWEERLIRIPQTELPKVMTPLQETPFPTQELEVTQQVTPPPGFLGVMACLRRNQSLEGSLEGAHQVSPDPLVVGVMLAHWVATISTSHIVKEEVTGVTYMDMVTTLVGRVALIGPEEETSAQGPKIEDITDLI